jgi:hypothetical protein
MLSAEIKEQLQREGKIETWILDWFAYDPFGMKEKDPDLYSFAFYWYRRAGGNTISLFLSHHIRNGK